MNEPWDREVLFGRIEPVDSNSMKAALKRAPELSEAIQEWALMDKKTKDDFRYTDHQNESLKKEPAGSDQQSIGYDTNDIVDNIILCAKKLEYMKKRKLPWAVGVRAGQLIRIVYNFYILSHVFKNRPFFKDPIQLQLDGQRYDAIDKVSDTHRFTSVFSFSRLNLQHLHLAVCKDQHLHSDERSKTNFVRETATVHPIEPEEDDPTIFNLDIAMKLAKIAMSKEKKLAKVCGPATFRFRGFSNRHRVFSLSLCKNEDAFEPYSKSVAYNDFVQDVDEAIDTAKSKIIQSAIEIAKSIFLLGDEDDATFYLDPIYAVMSGDETEHTVTPIDYSNILLEKNTRPDHWLLMKLEAYFANG